MKNPGDRGITFLPFNFRRMENDRVLIINLTGEYSLILGRNFSNLMSARSAADLGELYFSLKGKHFIADSNADLAVELLATKLRSRKEYLRAFTALHMVVVTARCNCKCSYCQASSSEPSAKGLDMTPEVAGHVVDIIFHSPSPSIKIEFQGGEPTLNWPVIEHIVKKAERLNRKRKKELSFVICSNLVRAEQKFARFCRDHNISFSTSLDGPPDLHDLHRRCRDGSGSHQQFVKNLEFYRHALGRQSCCALLTITRDSLRRLPEIIDHYISMGFRNVFLRALNPYGFAVKNSERIGYSAEEFVDAYCNALEYILSLNRSGQTFAELYASLLLQRILTPFSTGFVDLQSPSGAGISGAVYDYNGEVYPADEGRMLARMGDKRFLMGNVLHNSHKELFGGEILRELVRESCVETLPLCSDCPYQIYCGADPIRYYVECGDIRGIRPESEFCRKNRGILDYLFKKILENDEKTMDIFWSWIHPDERGCGDNEGSQGSASADC